MSNFALSFAPSKSFMYQWESGGQSTFFHFSVRKEGRVLLPDEVYVEGKPLFSLFSEGDNIYTELGGANNAFCLQAISKGVNVFRIPTLRLSQIFAQAYPDIKQGSDKERGQKSEIRRRQRALLLMELAQNHPEYFYPMRKPEVKIARIKTIIETYTNIQQHLRIPAQQRRYAMALDFYWLPDIENVRDLAIFREHLSSQTDIEYYLGLEKQLMNAIKRELQDIPIWTDFLESIKGIGPSLAGRLIAVIEDIRRFPKRDSFRAYAGWSVENGQAPRLRRRQNAIDRFPKFNPEFAKTLFLISEQIVRQGEKNSYHALYKEKKDYYQKRDPEVALIISERRARRAAASKFANDLWAAWWQIYAREGEDLPKGVLQVLKSD